MELNLKLTHELPEEIIEALGIDEDTVFSAYFSNGKIVIETVSEDENAELEEDNDENYTEDYKDGYKDGYDAAIHGEAPPNQLFGGCEISKDCKKCPFSCYVCGACNNRDWEEEDDE